MKNVLGAIALGLLIGGSIWYVFFRARGLIDHPRSGSVVILFGDSLAYGVGAQPGSDLAGILGARLGVRVINAGRSGDTAAAARERLAQDVLDRDPRVVIIILGGNDMLAGHSPEDVEAALGGIIDEIHVRGAGVLLVGIRGGDLGPDRYGTMYANLAAAKRTSFVPNALSGILGNANLSADELHPNSAGYRVLADRLEPLLRQMIEGRGILGS